MQTADTSLLTGLAILPDPRTTHGQRQPLTARLTVACVAMCWGRQTYGAIADWGRKYAATHPGWAAALGFTREELPCAATFFLLCRALDRQAFEAVVGQWAEAVVAGHRPPPATLAALARDAKSRRGSKKHGVPATQLLSAVRHRVGITLGHVPVDDQTNAMPVAPALISQLVSAGRVRTIDAVLSQRESAQVLVDQGGAAVLVVTANQPRLPQDIAAVFGSPRPGRCPVAAGADHRPRPWPSRAAADRGEHRVGGVPGLAGGAAAVPHPAACRAPAQRRGAPRRNGGRGDASGRRPRAGGAVAGCGAWAVDDQAPVPLGAGRDVRSRPLPGADAEHRTGPGTAAPVS